MFSPEAADRIGSQLDELKRQAQTLSADVRLYAQIENEAALRAVEVCAAIPASGMGIGSNSNGQRSQRVANVGLLLF